MKKRLIALVLAFALLSALLPTASLAVFAEEEEEKTIDRIEVEDFKLVYEVDGYWKDGYYDEEYNWVEEPYFEYNIYPDNVTVFYTDGTAEEEWFWDVFDSAPSIDTMGWGLGIHEVEIDFGWITVTYNVEIVMNPSGVCGENLTWFLDRETGLLTISGTGAMANYDWDSPWSKYAEQVRAISLPEGLTTIGDSAFMNLPITEVTIPGSVTSIGSKAFYSCSDLNTVSLSEGLVSIGYGAFNWCENLSSVNFPNSLTTIEDCAFYGCGLTELTLPDGLTTIGSEAFSNCENVTALEIPASVTVIGAGAFNGCKSVTAITISPENPAYCVEDGVLFNKAKTVLIQYPLAREATSYEIPEGVTELMTGAFWGAQKLETVAVPKTVENIGATPFSACPVLRTISVSEENPNYSSDSSGALFNKDKTVFIEYPVDGPEEYMLPATVIEVCDNAFFATHVKSVAVTCGVTTVGEFAFALCDELTDVILPPTLTEIQGWTFTDCPALETVKLPKNLTRIGDNAFARCESLKSMEIPDGVTSIGGFAFYECRSMTELKIADSVTEIGTFAFSGCSSLTSVILPSGLTAISHGLFNNCTSLCSVTIPDGVTEIGFDAFAGCPQLMGVKIPASVTDIFPYAIGFLGDNWGNAKVEGFTIYGYSDSAAEAYAEEYEFTFVDLTNPVVSGTCGKQLTWTLNTETGLLTIEGSGAMEDFGSYDSPAPWEEYNGIITELSLPVGLTRIGDMAFCECTALRGVTIPESVTEIGNIAFEGCSSLKSVEFPESLRVMEAAAFANCVALKTVSLPTGVQELGDVIFRGCSALTEVNVSPDNQNFSSLEGVLFNKERSLLIYYPTGKKDKSYEVPAGVNSIGWEAFETNVDLTGVCFPESLCWIGMAAFCGCTKLDSVSFQEGPLEICDYAFFGCEALTELTLPKGLTSIGWSAFESCVNLESVTLPEGLRMIRREAFQNCALRTVTIPASVVSIEDLALGYIELEKENEVGTTTVVDEKVEGFEIHGVMGTVAQTYAETNDFAFVPEQPAVSFTDVGEEDYFFTPVAWAVSSGVTAGMGDGSFGAVNTCTREQIVTFLWKTCGAPKAEAESCDFTDVQPGQYYYNAVLWAKEKGITSGMGDGTFGVGQPCTRAQAMTFLWVSMDRPAPTGENSFTDVEEGVWYCDPIRWAKENGVTAGMGDGTFGVNVPCTRAQIIAFLYKVIKIVY